jgi:protein-disulfide isomerase-like protein with CxxC motif
VDLPPLDLLLYARSRDDPRERFVVLTAVQMAYPALHRDPDWMKLLQDLHDEIGLSDAEHAAIVRRAEGVAKALREAFEGEPPPG